MTSKAIGKTIPLKIMQVGSRHVQLSIAKTTESWERSDGQPAPSAIDTFLAAADKHKDKNCPEAKELVMRHDIYLPHRGLLLIGRVHVEGVGARQ
jgi:hypothetical protein